MKKVIGLTLFIDIYNVEKKFLQKDFLLKLLKNLIKFLRVKPVGKPIIKKIFSKGNPYSGYTLVQVIKESHIVFNTWPEYKFLSIDIFSCKPLFNQKEILKFLKSEFENKNKIKFKIKSYPRVIDF